MAGIVYVRYTDPREEIIEITFSDNTTVVEMYNGTLQFPNTQAVNKWVSKGGVITPYDPNYGIPPDKLAVLKRVRLEELTAQHIQEVINAYNAKYNVSFDSVHTAANYINSPNYTHYSFCVAVWEFNVNVWEFARKLLDDVSNNVIPEPTEAEYLTMLPKYTGVM